MLSLIGIFIFALAEFVFDYAAVGESTNWSIFYFACTYLAIGLVSLDLFHKETSKSLRFTGVAFAVFFLLLLIIELTFINVPFDKYIVSVNDNKIRIIIIGLLAIVLLFITLTAWEKRLLKR